MSWSIAVKTVGSSRATPTAEEPDAASSGEGQNFTVHVSPDDGLDSLHDQIQGVTGLEASQQRLIYRGRLITEPQEEKGVRIREISGLCDGQTIHLVPRPTAPPTDPTADSSSPSTGTTGTDANTLANDALNSSLMGSSVSGSGTASLLATLLGLGLDDDETDVERRSQRHRLAERTAGRSSRRRRPNAYRRTADDLILPDPGSLEPVRQGLLTLHTMLPEALSSRERLPSLLETPRSWYRGQWLDCRDTVNQWLEATVVDIFLPEDVLPAGFPRAARRPSSTLREPPMDPAVGADDMEGRRRLLLEPVDDAMDLAVDDLSGYQERDTNEGVQVLLIHYNGWPHRWDEWIRSDSERIRPFRTRTRHRSTAPYASPTPQSVFQAAPATHFKDENDDVDRLALLPELARALSAVQAVLMNAVPPEEDQCNDHARAMSHVDPHLPWVPSPRPMLDDEMSDDDHQDDEAAITPENIATTNGRNDEIRGLDRAQLQSLAPLLDRLGRTLTDAAPHIAALADSAPEAQESSASTTASSLRMQRSLFSMISGLTSERRPTTPNANESATTPLLSEAATADSPERSSSRTTTNRSPLSIPPATDPDYVDFLNGMVNVSRGDNTPVGSSAVRSGARDRRGASDDGASLLASYLAGDGDGGGGGTTIPGLGRLLRVGNSGGNGGGGIDIHIHAIVTGPGMMAGTAAGLGDLGTATTLLRDHHSPTTTAHDAAATVRPPVTNDDDDGLFSELYSEGLPHTARDEDHELQREDNHFNHNLNDNDDNEDDTDDDLPPLHSRHSSSSSSDDDDDNGGEEELDDLPDLLGDENSIVEGDASSMTMGGAVRPQQRSPLGRFFRRMGRRGDPS